MRLFFCIRNGAKRKEAMHGFSTKQKCRLSKLISAYHNRHGWKDTLRNRYPCTAAAAGAKRKITAYVLSACIEGKIKGATTGGKSGIGIGSKGGAKAGSGVVYAGSNHIAAHGERYWRICARPGEPNR